MLKYLVFGLSLLLFFPLVLAVHINEIMYNPIGSDNYREFIEIYSENASIDLDGYIISDGDSNDTLKKINNYSSNFILVVEDGYILDIPENVSLYSAGATIGNGLSEDDKIFLYDKNKTIVDSVEIFKIDDGYSLEYYNGEFYQSFRLNGTPGYENSYNEELTQDYKKLRINELFPDPFGHDDAEMPNGEFVELYNSGNYNLNIEGLKLKDEANHEIIITNTNTKSLVIKSKDYQTVYMNGFYGFLNNKDFEKIYLYKGDLLLNEVSYFNSYEDLTWSKQEDGYWRLRKPTPNEKNQENEPEYESTLEIKRINLGSDEKPKFGDNLLVSVSVYKGNTSRYAVYSYIKDTTGEQISKRTSFHVDQKYMDYDFTIPVQIEPNCNNKYPNGKYLVALEGLGEEITKEIEISGITTSLCEKVDKKCQECKSTIATQARIENNLNASTNQITSNILYESSDIKAQRSAIYIFCLITIILTLHLILKKWK